MPAQEEAVPQRTVKARRQRERRLEAPPVLLQELRAAVLAAEMRPAQERIQRAVDREVLLVVNPTLARQLREIVPPKVMLVQVRLPTTIPTIPVASGPEPGARTGRIRTRKS